MVDLLPVDRKAIGLLLRSDGNVKVTGSIWEQDFGFLMKRANLFEIKL